MNCCSFIYVIIGVIALYHYFVITNVLLLKPAWKVLHLHAVLHFDVANASSSQADEVSAAVQGFSDVAGQSADVCAFAADDANGGLHRLRIEVLKFYLINDEHLGLEFYLPTLSGKVIRALPIYLAG